MNTHSPNNFRTLATATFLFFSGYLVSCGRVSEGTREKGEHIDTTVSASVETDPTPRGKNDDSADDPAIWIHPENPEKSVIFGTDKKGGLAAYNLEGKELYYYYTGNMNNCDIRYQVPLNGSHIDVLAATNRTSHSLSLFRIREEGKLDSIHSRIITSQMTDEVYGLCMYHSQKTGKFFVFINSKAGEVEQWEIINLEKRLDGRLVRSFSLHTQTEGMVADDETGYLYIGEEIAGIWKFRAEPDESTEGILIANSTEENPKITYDIEGLALYKTGPETGWLIASSQGNYSYAVFERENQNRYIGSFRITDGNIDGVEETDGIEITAIPLGPGFENGIMVAQDGYNYDGKKKKSQNYKIISWKNIQDALKLYAPEAPLSE